MKKRVLVTGASGFLGYHIYKELAKREDITPILLGWTNRNPKPLPHLHTIDLRDEKVTKEFFRWIAPNYVIHAAGFNGGLAYNVKFPADILDANLKMGLNVYEAAKSAGVGKVVGIMSSCCYPDGITTPMTEGEFYDGVPNQTIRAHGFAKKVLNEAAIAYKQQWGMESAILCITNLLGPYDTFNLERTKVGGAIIRKIVEAKESGQLTVQFFGTGEPRREIMHVKDAAKTVVMAMEHHNDSFEFMNVGTGKDDSLKDLVQYACDGASFHPKIEWDASKPNGQMVKRLDNSKMMEMWRSVCPQLKVTSARETIAQTMKWFVANRDELALA